jgi:hypothetical protein
MRSSIYQPEVVLARTALFWKLWVPVIVEGTVKVAAVALVVLDISLIRN